MGDQCVFPTVEVRWHDLAYTANGDHSEEVVAAATPVACTPELQAQLAARRRFQQYADDEAHRNVQALEEVLSLEARVQMMSAADDWEGVIASISALIRNYGTTPYGERAQALLAAAENARTFASAIVARQAERLDEPRRRFVARGGTMPSVPGDLSTARSTPGPLSFGASVDVWYTTPGGWVLVALPTDAQTGGALTSMLGWLREDDVTPRDLIAEERARWQEEARREQASLGAEARRAAVADPRAAASGARREQQTVVEDQQLRSRLEAQWFSAEACGLAARRFSQLRAVGVIVPSTNGYTINVPTLERAAATTQLMQTLGITEREDVAQAPAVHLFCQQRALRQVEIRVDSNGDGTPDRSHTLYRYRSEDLTMGMGQ